MKIKVTECEASAAIISGEAITRLLCRDRACLDARDAAGRLVTVDDGKGRRMRWLCVEDSCGNESRIIPLEGAEPEKDAPPGERYRAYAVRVTKDRVLMGIESPAVYDRIYTAHFKEILLLVFYYRRAGACLREVWFARGKKARPLSLSEIDSCDVPEAPGYLDEAFLSEQIAAVRCRL